MENTLLIQLTNQKALKLLQELEALQLIKVLKKSTLSSEPKLSDKYKGIITKEQGQELKKHVEQMRGEWNNI